jgi:hypothetical protein
MILLLAFKGFITDLEVAYHENSDEAWLWPTHEESFSFIE